MGHVLTSLALLALPRSTPLHYSEAQCDRNYSTKSPNRSTIRPHSILKIRKPVRFMRDTRPS